jgi:hypothetical protein
MKTKKIKKTEVADNTKLKGTATVLRKVPQYIADLRFLVENYYDVQDNRLRSEGRNRAWLQIYNMPDAQMDIYQENISDKFLDIEKWIYKQLDKEVKKHPLWKNWLVDVLGVGPALAGGFIGWIGDVSNFATISALNSYCGYACDNNGDAVRRKKGQKINWNPNLKKHLWKFGESIIKTKGKYREFYDKSKEYYKKKYPEEIKVGNITKYTKGHIHNMAIRKTEKLFLSHLWLTWRELEGLSTRSPYALEKLGHTTFIPPFRDKNNQPGT